MRFTYIIKDEPKAVVSKEETATSSRSSDKNSDKSIVIVKRKMLYYELDFLYVIKINYVPYCRL